VLARLTSQVAFAAATEESRLMLTGVLTKLAGDQITMAAADGFRLSVATGTLSYPVPKPMSLLIPAQSLADLGNIAGDQEEPVKMTVTSSGRQVVFGLESAELVSQLIDLQFPDYEQIVPNGHTTRTVVDRQALLKACRRASIFAREAAYAVKLRAERGTDVTPGRLTIFGRSDQAGDNTGQIDAEVMGEEMEIMFNVRYFLDALPVIDTAQVALETTTARAPGALKPVGDDSFIHVLMPMYDENKAQGK
jgi:DNA polymerase-3 subunit beta